MKTKWRIDDVMSHSDTFRYSPIDTVSGWEHLFTDLGGVGREHVKLVHRQAQFAQVDVEVDHHVPRHGRREHFLEGQRCGETFLSRSVPLIFLDSLALVSTEL